MEIEARKIVYVSCNPATQARDLLLLKEKYDIVKIQPVDMFPHTQHVENVVELILKEHIDRIRLSVRFQNIKIMDPEELLKRSQQRRKEKPQSAAQPGA